MHETGVMGATQILALAIAGIAQDRPDPDDEGIGGDITAIENGVEATIEVPGGDRYTITVQWDGDREADS